MISIIDKKQCSGCAACFNACPKEAISMVEDNEGFLYPQINNKCISCNLCESVCPYLNTNNKTEDIEKCFTAFNKNEQERIISSSGGMFILFAKEVLKCGGIVYGSAYDEAFLAEHVMIDDEKNLYRLVGSKYMQSRIGNIYKDVKRNLEIGKKVLFVGTACQIGGLRSFLRYKYDNLICVDFVCLGVPSPKVWRDYLNTFFEGEKVQSVNFKNKKLGWHTFSLQVKTNKREFCKNGRQTFFFSGYFKQLYSRPSCSECIYKGGNRISDITISDCWGYSIIAPEMDDNKGLSSIECHTEKGLQLFNSIKNNIEWKESNIADVKIYNSNYYKSAAQGNERRAFWQDYDVLTKKILFEKYCRPEKTSIIKKIRNRMNRIVKKVKK